MIARTKFFVVRFIADVMIFTPSVDKDQKRSKAFMEDRNRFNVATSRAKYFTYFVHGELPSNMLLMQQMLAKMGQGKKDVSDIDLVYLPIGWSYEPSACESEFELIVADVIADQDGNIDFAGSEDALKTMSLVFDIYYMLYLNIKFYFKILLN